jgi:protoporphyrinogen oxidase
MAWLWGRIKQRQDAKKAGEKFERLGYYDGGFNSVTEALVADLKKLKAGIHTETPVQSINSADKGKVVLKANGQEVTYDSVISTVPSYIFAKQIETEKSVPTEYINKLTSIDYLDAVLMVISTPQAISDYYWHQFQDKDAPFLVALSLTALTKNTKPYDGNHVYYIGDYVTHDNPIMAQSEDQIRKKWFKGLKDLFPDFDTKLIDESHVFKFRNAQHIVDVGYQDDKLTGIKTPIENVYLSNFSQIFPQDRGTNYAVRDGETAAKLIHKKLKG